jgi:hypothetical protein
MNPRVESSINRIAEQARSRYAAMLGSARNQTEQAAGRIRDGKKPVKALSRLGVKLTDVSHRATAKVLKQQTTLVENQMDALAARLRTAANADNVRDLVRDQIRLIPANASQFLTDTRASLAIVAEAGGEVRQLLTGTVSDLRGRGKTPAKAAKSTVAKAKAKTRSAKKVAAKATTKTKGRAKAKKSATTRPAAKTPVATPRTETKAA